MAGSLSPRVILALLMLGAFIACTADPPQKGGIFGDRPVDTTEPEGDSSVRDGGSDVTDAKSDRADTSTPPKDAEDDT